MSDMFLLASRVMHVACLSEVEMSRTEAFSVADLQAALDEHIRTVCRPLPFETDV